MDDYSEFNGIEGRHATYLHNSELWFRQSGLCAWCDTALSRSRRGGHVDHNHRCCPYPGLTCGKCVRGLVHPWCNRRAIVLADKKYLDGHLSKLKPWQLDYITRGEPDSISFRELETGTDPLVRFSYQIGKAVALTMKKFDLPWCQKDDVRQEACRLVLSFAGYFDESTNRSQSLKKWEELASEENGVKALLARQLSLDLNQLVGRQVRKGIYGKGDCVGIYLPDFDNSKSISAEDAYMFSSDAKTSSDQLRREYPFLTAQVFDGLTIAELTKLGSKRISRATVFRRLREEKERFINESG